MQFKAYSLHNFKTIPQVRAFLSEEQIRDIEVVGSVLPFRTNNYVIDELIDWNAVPDDPMFIATFPQKAMLSPTDYRLMRELHDSGADSQTVQDAVRKIRLRLNPHPAGQQEYNTPIMDGETLQGLQHKYRETVLFFPGQGQVCHAYCTFCFRWPQFTKMEELKISSCEVESLVSYLAAHPEVTDVLFTGGDPMTMKAQVMARYIEPLLAPELSHIRTIRIGTRSLTFWPYRFVTDPDAAEMLDLFRKVRSAGKHLSFMAHFNHPVELETEIVRDAICRIQDTGAVIRTQSPLLKHINDAPEVWAELWRRQVALNCVPYYMFIARDTGAQRYFSVPLVRAWEIYQQAFQSVSGICRTAGGPSMSAFPGKVQVLGVSEIHGKKVFVLRMVQGRDPDWVDRPFFAAYDERATWFEDLKPAFGEKEFFFETELQVLLTPGEYEGCF